VSRPWKVLLVTSVAVFMALLDVTIVNIAFPDIRRSFPADPLADLSWILNAYNVVFAAALVPAGRLADRFGRRRFFLAGIVVFLAASVACAAAGTVIVLVIARIVQAVGAAVLVPTSLSLVLPEFPPAKRATATALWTATGAVAAATGPSLGGLLVDWQGWRWVFLVNLVIGLPALLPAARLLRESKDEQATGWPDLAGTVLLATAVAALALAMVKGQDWGWGSARVLGGLIAFGVLTGAFTIRSTRHAAPVIDLSLFRIRSFSVANAGAFVFGVGFFAQLLNGVLFLNGVWGYSALKAGVALTPGPIAAAVCAPVAGRLADRFGQRVIAIPGCALFAAGALLLALSTATEPHYVTNYLPGLALAGAGIGFALPAFGSAAVAELPPARFATGSGVAACFRQLGAVVGIAGLVAVLGETTEPLDAAHRAWVLISVTGAVAALTGAALGRISTRPTARATPAPGPSVDQRPAR
jgi:EmrB/QacA subfamily drug resistance transporter